MVHKIFSSKFMQLEKWYLELMHISIKSRDVQKTGCVCRAPARQSSDVLSDIDNMLQGLTDELDAMLLEETVG